MKKAPLVVQNLLLLLPMVRQADLDIKNFFKSVQQNQQGNIKLNKLLVEMLPSQKLVLIRQKYWVKLKLQELMHIGALHRM